VRKIRLVLVREYLENVRTKAFLIAVLLTPLLGALSFLLPRWAAAQEVPTRTLAVADTTGVLGPAVREALERRGPSAPEAAPLDEDAEEPASPIRDARATARGPEGLYRVEEVALSGETPAEREASLADARTRLSERVKAGELFGWVVIRPSALERKGGAPSEITSGNVADFTVAKDVSDAIHRAADAHLVKTLGIPPETARLLSTTPAVASRSVAAEGRAGAAAAAFAPMVVMFVLFLTIVGTSQALITSTLEEKGNRVVEVLLSSVSPFQLMTGKVLGVCGVGLTLMAIWGSAGIAALAANGLLGLVAGPTLPLAVLYYVLGFLLIASLMVAVGSACNTLKEAQNLLSPLMVLLTLPMLLFVVVMKDPHGPVATGLSFVPFFTPFLMMMRIGQVQQPPTLEIVGSLVLLAVSTALAMWLAARVFRVGVLLYGKPPSLREIFRWMRSGA
jgi:ABC-2 type transport system permease protein